MSSLRTRLFFILLAATSIIWGSAVAWIYFQSRTELEHVMDTRLQEAARMVSSLVGDRSKVSELGAAPDPANYDRQLSCQIWTLGGRLLARSSGAPDTRLSTAEDGFSDTTIDGEPWRVYVVQNATNGTRVMVGDRIGLRSHLIDDLILGLVAPAVLIVPLLGLLIWMSLGRGLKPLYRMARVLIIRSPEDMTPVKFDHAPRELRPLAEALNVLLAKLHAARQHEREFTSFAAHELRTPLAGLRTQAQIAIASTESDVIRSALNQILVSVDRSGRLIKQLLTLARLDSAVTDLGMSWITVGEVIKNVVKSVDNRHGLVETTIDPELFEHRFCAPVDALTLAFRNLQENAVKYSPNGGTIEWVPGLEPSSIRVIDKGPGVPLEDLPHLGKRFFRGKTMIPQGSGLGLAIARVALMKMDAELRFRNFSDEGGFCVEIVFAGKAGGPLRRRQTSLISAGGEAS